MDVTEDDLYVPRPAIRDLSLRCRHQGQTIMDRQHASSLEVELSACEQLCLVMMAAFHRHRDFFFRRNRTQQTQMTPETRSISPGREISAKANTGTGPGALR